MASYTITVSIAWGRVEPDGSECTACGDRCYLTMWRWLVSTGTSSPPQVVGPVLCGSCYDCIAS